MASPRCSRDPHRLLYSIDLPYVQLRRQVHQQLHDKTTSSSPEFHRQMSLQPPQSAVDRQLSLTHVGGDVELLREIAALFIEDCPRALAELRQAVEQQDASKLENAAHALKGSVANFGAQDAVDAAFRLEQMGRSGTLSESAEALGALEHALLTVCAELAAL